MTLEYQEIMEDVKRRICIKCFKSNTRIFDDNSIEVTPQAVGVPLQRDVKKSGRCKRYATTGKKPLTCVELKCPDEVVDKAAYFRRELAKLNRDIEICEPALPAGQYLIDNDHLKVRLVEGDKRQILAWLTLDIEGELNLTTQLYQLSSEICKCFVSKEDIIIRARN
jgi:hypothetical protein